MSTGARAGSTRPKSGAATAPGTPPPIDRKPSVSIERRPGAPARIFVSLGPSNSVEITHAFTAAIAHALWQLRGGQDIANWVDAERLAGGFLASTGTAPTDPAPEIVLPRRRTSKSV